jgi:hypothetical protein
LGGQAAAWGHSQALWVSEAAQLVLESCSHMSEESKRQACRMTAMLSAYALHDPDTGYCQGWVPQCFFLGSVFCWVLACAMNAGSWLVDSSWIANLLSCCAFSH